MGSTVLHVLARRALIEPSQALTAEGAREFLLLEGAWPEQLPESWCSTNRQDLDHLIDARFAWVDAAAEQFATALTNVPAGEPTSSLDLAYLNALKLRYYIVKLMRVVVFFQEFAPHTSQVVLHLEPGDDDYATLFASISATFGFHLHWHWHKPTAADTPPQQPPSGPNFNIRPWRRAFKRALGMFALWSNPALQASTPLRTLFCGNRLWLDPVCEEVLRRGGEAWWLYERFAIRPWFDWRRRGVGQLTCETSSAAQPVAIASPTASNLLSGALPLGRCDLPLPFHGVDLAPTLRHWLADRSRELGHRQAQWVNQIRRHLAHIRPHMVVMDEDATPFTRTLVAVARSLQIPTVVIQHGVPRVRFAFAPQAADWFCAWGRTSQQQIAEWGVPSDRLIVTGSPRYDGWLRSAVRPTAEADEPQHGTTSTKNTILYLATTPPSPRRPDAIGFGMTEAAHAHLLRSTCEAVSSFGRFELVIKLHPRCRNVQAFNDVLQEFPDLPARIVWNQPIDRLAAQAVCVISCASGGGLDASWLGHDVLDLLPPGAVDLLPSDLWGTHGTASHAPDIQAWLEDLFERRAMDVPRTSDPRHAQVLENLNRSATATVVDFLWERPTRNAMTPLTRRAPSGSAHDLSGAAPS